jgi:hypothetical protein
MAQYYKSPFCKKQKTFPKKNLLDHASIFHFLATSFYLHAMHIENQVPFMQIPKPSKTSQN